LLIKKFLCVEPEAIHVKIIFFSIYLCALPLAEWRSQSKQFSCGKPVKDRSCGLLLANWRSHFRKAKALGIAKVPRLSKTARDCRVGHLWFSSGKLAKPLQAVFLWKTSQRLLSQSESAKA